MESCSEPFQILSQIVQHVDFRSTAYAIVAFLVGKQGIIDRIQCGRQFFYFLVQQLCVLPESCCNFSYEEKGDQLAMRYKATEKSQEDVSSL